MEAISILFFIGLFYFFCSPSRKNIDKNTSLMTACQQTNPQIVEALIKQGADVNYKSKDG